MRVLQRNVGTWEFYTVTLAHERVLQRNIGTREFYSVILAPESLQRNTGTG